MRSRFYTAALSLTLSVAMLPAQSTPTLNKEGSDEIYRHTLTMDEVTRFAQAFSDIAKFAKDHPDASAAVDTSSDKQETIAAIDQRISAHPEVAALITQHGFTVHNFIVAEVTILQAGLAAAMIQPGADTAKVAADAHINPANITFMQQHKTEFEELKKKYGLGGDGGM